jgi:hypothetical protein
MPPWYVWLGREASSAAKLGILVTSPCTGAFGVGKKRGVSWAEVKREAGYIWTNTAMASS